MNTNLFGSSDNDYKSHIDELEDWPIFKITNDRVSGRIPITKIESWKTLPELLDDAFNGIMSKIKKNLDENSTLSELRDTLLPKLISGEVGV